MLLATPCYTNRKQNIDEQQSSSNFGLDRVLVYLYLTYLGWDSWQCSNDRVRFSISSGMWMSWPGEHEQSFSV